MPTVILLQVLCIRVMAQMGLIWDVLFQGDFIFCSYSHKRDTNAQTLTGNQLCFHFCFELVQHAAVPDVDDSVVTR